MIEVNEKYRIKEEIVDYSIWEKEKDRGKKKGKFICKGYYKTLSEAVQAILYREAQHSTANVQVDLESAISRLQRVEESYRELAKRITEGLSK